METLSRNIEMLRLKRLMTQEELAKRIGVTQGTISQYEKGLIIPKIDTAVRLAAALGTTCEALMGSTEK